MISPMGRQRTLKGLATRNPRVVVLVRGVVVVAVGCAQVVLVVVPRAPAQPARRAGLFHAHARLFQDAGKRAGFDLGMHGNHATGLIPLHHHTAAALAGFLKAELPERLAAPLPLTTGNLGMGNFKTG